MILALDNSGTDSEIGRASIMTADVVTWDPQHYTGTGATPAGTPNSEQSKMANSGETVR